MMKIEHTEVVGWEAAIRGMRNPLESWEKSESLFNIHINPNYLDTDTLKPEPPVGNDILGREYFAPGEFYTCLDNTDMYIAKNDLDLMTRLRNAGTDHRKFMRMIVVYVDITAPLYWWKEFDTYKVGTVANSCSTMHCIHKKEFTLEDFSCEYLIPFWDSTREAPKDVLGRVISELNYCRSMYLKSKDKKYWWQMIQLLPSSYNQKRTVMLNYEVLANMYKSRKDHKLDEWHTFCEWIEGLPYSELITGGMTDEETDKMFEEVNKILKTEYPKPDDDALQIGKMIHEKVEEILKEGREIDWEKANPRIYPKDGEQFGAVDAYVAKMREDGTFVSVWPEPGTVTAETIVSDLKNTKERIENGEIPMLIGIPYSEIEHLVDVTCSWHAESLEGDRLYEIGPGFTRDDLTPYELYLLEKSEAYRKKEKR